jgi:hypothetical protein
MEMWALTAVGRMVGGRGMRNGAVAARSLSMQVVRNARGTLGASDAPTEFNSFNL